MSSIKDLFTDTTTVQAATRLCERTYLYLFRPQRERERVRGRSAYI